MDILNSAEISRAQSLINNLPEGIYELSNILGDAWDNVSSPYRYGQQFRRAVMSGRLQKIQHHSKKPNNHQTYLIRKSTRT